VDAVRQDVAMQDVWYRINDSHSRRIGNGEAVVRDPTNQMNAYILLYIRKEVPPVAEESKDFVQTSNQCESAKKGVSEFEQHLDIAIRESMGTVDIPIRNDDDSESSSNEEMVTPYATANSSLEVQIKCMVQKHSCEPLRCGDVIQYWNPIYSAGHYLGRCVAQVLATRPGTNIPLELDNGNFLPSDHRVIRIYEFLQQELIRHPGMARPISAFDMTDAVLEDSIRNNVGLQQQVEEIRRQRCNRETDNHAAKSPQGTGDISDSQSKSTPGTGDVSGSQSKLTQGTGDNSASKSKRVMDYDSDSSSSASTGSFSRSSKKHKIHHSGERNMTKMPIVNKTAAGLHQGFKTALLRPWNGFLTYKNGQLYKATKTFLETLSALSEGDSDSDSDEETKVRKQMDCRTRVANSMGDVSSIFPRDRPTHLGELVRENQEKICSAEISYMSCTDTWIKGRFIEEFQRGLARLQNGDILNLAENGGGDRHIFVRQLGHARTPLHMFSTNHFNLLFGIAVNREGKKTNSGWLRNVSTSIRNGFGKHAQRKLLPTRNIGMLRPTNYPYIDRTAPDSRATHHLPFRSQEWDHVGTRFFSIPINRWDHHWVGVIVERCGLCEEDGKPTGILHFYDLLTIGPSETKLRHEIMEHIGKSLNLVPVRVGKGTKDYLDCYKWKYSDVVSSEWMRQNGTIQKDSHSCGVIWMMIIWFVVTKERAPTLEDCRKLWRSAEELTNFRTWVVYSILVDRIWLPPERTNLEVHYDTMGVPSEEEWQRNHRRAVISKLPVRDSSTTNSDTDVSSNEDDVEFVEKN
jgi:hypothetical protein